MARSIIFLEANEIPDRVLDHYMLQYPDSTLSRRMPACERYSTVAADTCALSPWITWPTLHRGVNNEAHGIMHFGQNLDRADASYPPIWHLLKEAGVPTGVFGPLHSSPLPADAADYCFFLPDTFAHTPESHPDALTAFQDFNLTMARNSPRNVSRSVDPQTMFAFLTRAPFLGLRPSTAIAVARQLLEERSAHWKSTRRRTYQPVLAFDLFMKQVASKKPAFSNFFTNHVASAMHRYWAALFPDDFEELELGEDWQDRFRGEIDFAMSWTNRFFERVVRFADRNPEYIIVLASSMGQGPASGKRINTQLYLRDPAPLLEHAGIAEDRWERRPAMDPTVSLLIAEGEADEFARFLDGMTIQGKAIEYARKEGGFFDLVFGQVNVDPQVDEITVDGERVSFDAFGFEMTEVEDEAGSTGYHIPEGILVVYDPQDKAPKSGSVRTISTTDLAPALLDHFGVAIPDYMSAPGAINFGR